MPNKLAAAFVCIGIALGSLGAPKGNKPCAAVTKHGMDAPVSLPVDNSSAAEIGAVQPCEPATNIFGVAL